MPRSKLEVFTELYELSEANEPVSESLKEEARTHGLRIEAVKNAALASQEDDCDDE